MRRLTRASLAAEAGTTAGRIDDLVRVGVLAPADDGSFTSSDIQRVRVVDAYESGGISLALIELAIERRWISFHQTEAIYPDPGPRSARTVNEFVESLGERSPLLEPLLAAFGLPTPAGDAHLTEHDERMLADFLTAWDVSDDDTVAVRAARLAGESIRRTVDGWLDLFVEQVTRPLEDRTRTVDETVPVIVPRASGIVDRAPEVLVWLFERHLEAGLDAVNTASMESGLAREGLLPDRSMHPPAIAFADLAGFTRLTQEHGDEIAARSAAKLAELSSQVARARDGRLVKLLGDGAMLWFPDPRRAVEASLDLVAAVAGADLAPAHIGVNSGPVIGRDGDFFGHTVNVAARLAGRAAPGETLVTREVVEAVGESIPGITFEPVGELDLRNVLTAVTAFRAGRSG